ncbi:hypothetical protein BH11BAC7_BH11BAC7_02930 [soil metagenome]
MKKILFILLFLILICITFKAMHWNGAKAIVELSSVVVGILYLVISRRFFKGKQNRLLNILLGCTLITAAAFAILPLLLYFLNSITFIVNINYNDILFNYYKLYLNSLIGLLLFAIVCIIHFTLQIKMAPDEKEKRNYKILVALTLVFIIVLSIVITRNLGYHLSFSRTLSKIILLLAVLVILPYLFVSRLIRNNLFPMLSLIFTLTFLNGIPGKYLFSADFSLTRWFVYTKPVRENGDGNVDSLKTISSFKALGDNFYEMTFYGNYNPVLEANNKRCLEESINPGHNCSLFTSSGDSSTILFGRSFDNPYGWKCKTMLCRCNPQDGYASLSLVRMADIGFDVSIDMSKLSYAEKLPLLNSLFFIPDGINEKGLVVAMAAVEERKLIADTSKPYINCTYLVREMLEQAKNIDEAVLLMNKYNIMNDVWSGSFDQHMLIADASGRSVVAEISEGKFRFAYNTQPWLATTNDPSFNKTIADQKKVCPRFKTISDLLENKQGKLTPGGAMLLLKQVGHQYTEWSVVYDISKRQMDVAIDYNFNKIYHFGFDGK